MRAQILHDPALGDTKPCTVEVVGYFDAGHALKITMNTLPYYTYVHRRATDGSVFYVGMGSGRRAYHKHAGARTARWLAAVAEHGRVVQIVDRFATTDEARDAEVETITHMKAFGQKLLNNVAGGNGGRGVSRPPVAEALDNALAVVNALGAARRSFPAQRHAETLSAIDQALAQHAAGSWWQVGQPVDSSGPDSPDSGPDCTPWRTRQAANPSTAPICVRSVVVQTTTALCRQHPIDPRQTVADH